MDGCYRVLQMGGFSQAVLYRTRFGRKLCGKEASSFSAQPNMRPTKLELLPEIGDDPIVGRKKVVIFCNLDPLTSNLCIHYEKEQQKQFNL